MTHEQNGDQLDHVFLLLPTSTFSRPLLPHLMPGGVEHIHRRLEVSLLLLFVITLAVVHFSFMIHIDLLILLILVNPHIRAETRELVDNWYALVTIFYASCLGIQKVILDSNVG